MKPLRYVDVHIHLSDEEYDKNVDEIVSEARKSNVTALVSNSMDLVTSIKSLELSEKYAGTVYAALGIHPWNLETLTEDQIQETCQFILRNRGNSAVLAIGEVGLDYKYDKIWDKQLMVFDEMLHIAEKLSLPVIIHSRGTTAKIVEMLPSYGLKGVLLHWFSNPLSILPKVVEKGYCISEGPPVVYSGGIREVIRRTPLTNILTETDGPIRYFKSPFNGKTTTPAFIPAVVKAIAEIKRASEAEVAEQLIENFQRFFAVKS
ncbi:MAG: TatD family hydrolase [Nitrososphaerota archaeon]|nr:TatD family hydrolase [Candidatus Bathyarchaeota archaeon]MDW8023247.1 TatD family hydrolase [Nitrososphaerota archaeon]